MWSSQCGAARWVAALAFVGSLTAVASLNAKEWQRRTVYQIITDRFAIGPDSQDHCGRQPDFAPNPFGCYWGVFCGGSWRGIIDKLDYIQGMGFDALWISPVVTNLPCGYHGYWTMDLWSIEPRFGGEAGLTELMEAAHARGMAVLLDTVLNHMGPTFFAPEAPDGSDFGMYSPFNAQEHYHGNPRKHLNAQGPYVAQRDREHGWLGFVQGLLPDLNHENPFVTEQLMDFVQHTVAKYKFDGVRIDAAPYVNKSFYQQLKQRLGDLYLFGEVIVERKGYAYLYSYQFTESGPPPLPQGELSAEEKGYQKRLLAHDPDIYLDGVSGNVLDGIENLQLFHALRDVLASNKSPLAHVKDIWGEVNRAAKDLSACVNFIDGHDDSRWFNVTQDVRSYHSAVVVDYFLPGVPVSYYGAEQHMHGPGGFGTNGSRYPLWNHGYARTDLYKWTGRAVRARKAALESLPDGQLGEVDLELIDDLILTWQRGSARVVVSKSPEREAPRVRVRMSAEGQRSTFENALNPGETYEADAAGFVTVAADGNPLVLFELPRAVVDGAASIALSPEASMLSFPFLAVWLLLPLAALLTLLGAMRASRQPLDLFRSSSWQAIGNLSVLPGALRGWLQACSKPGAGSREANRPLLA